MIHSFVRRDRIKALGAERVFDIIRSPIMTEKTTSVVGGGQYTFQVLKNANKIEIKKAVEKLFSVKVLSVNTLIVFGKKKKFRGRLGYRSDKKKAIVSLEKGYSLDFVEGQVS